MGDFTQAIDIIKEKFGEEWLTCSQEEIMHQVLDARGLGRGQVLNIRGTFGVGKTFLGWTLAKRMNCYYGKLVRDVPADASIAILDDFPSLREENRRLLNQMKLRNIEQLIVITEARIDDDVWSVELKLLQKDLAKARANLFRVDLMAPEEEYENLWQLVEACEVKQ